MRNLLAALVLFTSPALAQTTWYVDVSGSPPGNGTAGSPFTSLQYAIDRPATIAGDTLLVAPGNYVENIVYRNKNLHVRSSAGPLATTITAATPGTIVLLNGDAFEAILEGFTVTGLMPGTIGLDAAVVMNSGSLRRCIVRDNVQGTGNGVVIIYDGELTDCTVSRNLRGIELQSFIAGAMMRNTITWKNLQEDLGLSGSSSTVDYCAGGLAGPANFLVGVGNIQGDAGLWNPDEGDLHLRPGSACIDAGDPNWPHDPDGSRHDIGALTYDATHAPGPAVFCTGKINSQGCTPQIGFSGHATSTGSAPFQISAINELPGKPGLLIYGPGKQFQPFQGALLCVQSPIKRVGAQIASGSGVCGGTYSFDFGAYLASGPQPQLFPGALIASQWWSRDQQDPSGWGSGLSDALFFGVAP
jgi:hypothetical protein